MPSRDARADADGAVNTVVDATGSDGTASAEFAIRAQGLTKRYDDTVAVADLDLSIPYGTVYGFLGPNGAGKTTTIRMLTTLLRPSDGHAAIDGHSVADRDRVTPRLGYLPESPPIHEELTGREQLEYVAGLRDLPDDHARERIATLLERFDLADAADDRIDTYSKGMRQKTGLIQAILHDPPVVFLDEPTSGLDPRAARTVRETIADLAAGDTTVFLSTHILSVVDELADTVGVLADGRLVAEGSPARLKRRAEGGERTLEEAFLEVTDDRGDATGRETATASTEDRRSSTETETETEVEVEVGGGAETDAAVEADVDVDADGDAADDRSP